MVLNIFTLGIYLRRGSIRFKCSMNNNSSSNRMHSDDNGRPAHTWSPTTLSSAAGRPPSLMDHQQSLPNVVRVVVTRDNGGYGMKVSGDNPVYVQSVKEGGPAEKAGLHAGDKIIQVNGTNVMQSTHTDVVVLIKSSAQVVLTVQQRNSLRSPGTRPSTTPSSTRITGPQPVGNEKQHQLQQEKEQCYRLMIEKEQHHVEKLRSQIAVSSNEKKSAELAKAEKNLKILQDNLLRTLADQQTTELGITRHLSSSSQLNLSSPLKANSDQPPPLPKRNKLHSNTDINSLFLTNEINANAKKRNGEECQDSEHIPSDVPPPLPPRTYPPYNSHTDNDAVNSIDKQMVYPLVATCTSLVNDFSAGDQPKHSRTKSSPESLMTLSAELHNCKNDNVNQNNWQQRPGTPPGTPPPPYPSPLSDRRDRLLLGDSCDGSFDLIMNSPDESFVDVVPNSPMTPQPNSSPIRATNSRATQQTIISMEDDDMSDLEIDQSEDHGHFKSLSRLWEHLPHLAVFMNYILSNSDPNSLLFYLLTDLFKEGNAKEMRKWAFEIHSCFLVPGAPLRLNNVDENIAREIDEDLTKQFDKEEIMRKIFWKARSRAKEELTKQLTDFQHKRTAGLGTIYGPSDSELKDHYSDKAKELKLYESLFLPKLELYLEEFEKDCFEPPKYFMAAALITVLTRIFKIRSPNLDMDRVPIFVNRERSLKSKFMGRYSRKINHMGHQFVSQQYYTVIPCNNCHQIIYGISPQGYQCSSCLINLHRVCVKLYDDACPGPITKKDRGIRKLIGMRHDSADQNKGRKVAASHFIQMEKDKRHLEERDNRADILEFGEAKVSQPVTRKGSDRKPEGGCEEGGRAGPEGDGQGSTDKHDDAQMPAEKGDSVAQSESSSISQSSGVKRKTTSHINRSESVKEQSDKNRKQQQRRNVSDPSHSFNVSSEVDTDRQQTFSKNADSGSSSNSNLSCNGRLSESPSTSMDVHQATVRTQSDSDSDMDGEADPLNWQELVTEEELKKLNLNEKKRQEVINELFLTEASHVRMLKVLYKLFYKTLHNNQILKSDEMNLLFPNIKELLDIHIDINKEMRRIRKEDPLVRQIGDVLLATFTGNQGEALQKASATFCERQQLALEFIKKRRERDSKFDALLTDCEKSRQCRRLQLQAIIPVQMQRLTRYPLLLERLVKSVEAADKGCRDYQDELVKLRQVHHHSKEILSQVNEAAKLAHNRHRLEEIQRHLEIPNFRASDQPSDNDFRNIDLTRYKLILEGGLYLRRPSKAPVPVHILLLEEMVVILQKENDRFILKFFQSGTSGQTPLSPIIKMSTLLVRENAVCKNALFLVNTSTTSTVCMYDLQAEDESKRETWRKHFSDAADAYNRREGKLNRGSTITTSSQEAASDSDTSSIKELSTESGNLEPEVISQPPDTPEVSTKTDDQESPAEEASGNQTPDMNPGGGIQLTTKVSAEEWPLIQPSQVNVVVPPVHTAESMLTPLEQIRRKDALVKQALAEKEDLVADLLSIPREHFEHIADMAVSASDVTTSGTSDMTDRLLASVFQVDLLQKAVNDAFNISEGEVVAAKGGIRAVCASQEPHYANDVRATLPSIPASHVRDIVTSLSCQLTTLLSDVKLVEEERDRLRKELHKMKEKLHEEHNLHSPVPFDDAASDGSAQEVYCEASSEEPK